MKTAAKKLGDYLTEEEPGAALWMDMVRIVHRDCPNGDYGRLGPSALTLHDCGRFSGEIINGGFVQFFDNSTGDRAHEILASLRRIGASVCVELLEKAMSLFPDGVVPSDCVARADVTDTFGKREKDLLEELDQVFYSRVDSLSKAQDEDLRALELAFIRAHRAENVEA